MCLYIVLVIEFLDDDVIYHCVEKCSVCSGTYARVDIGGGRGTRKSRIYVDDLRPILLRLADPLERHRMVFRDVASFHQNRFTVLQIDPVIGHCPSSERCPQTGDRGAVSKPGLMLDERGAKQPCCFLEQVALLVCVLRAAHECDRICTVDWNIGVTELLGGDPCLIARLANFLCNSLDRVIP